MILPFTLPDWVPSWVPLALLVPVLLFALAFLLMPFSVFGVKGRLEAVEARLDEIQGEIRSLSLRMPDAVHRAEYDDLYAPRGPLTPSRADPPIMTRPPIPPAAYELDADPGPPVTGRAGDARRGDRIARPRADERTDQRGLRAEPRFDRPD